jgi:hypothetical protein
MTYRREEIMRKAMTVFPALLLLAAAAWAAGPPATPVEGVPAGAREIIQGGEKAFGDPTDFAASLTAGADYLVGMQADITEDNAGNGAVDTDPDDGGWDWSTSAFTHSATASANNIYGATVQGIYRAYLLDPQPAYYTALKDAADHIVSVGPGVIRSGPDVIFLLKFANLPDCPTPAFYRAGAQAIWDYRITVYGSMPALAAYIRDLRHGQGYSNGIIPWDIAPWAEAAMLMDDAFPGAGHAAEAAAIAEVIYQDSFAGNPGYFDPDGANMGSDPNWNTPLYWWYTLGLSGIIDAFATSGTHTAELPGLQALLLACQYADGAFSDQYGATAGNDRVWQGSAYALRSLADNLPSTVATRAAMRQGAIWLASTQDASGGWVYDGGSHYPEVGGEITAGLAAAAGATVTAAASGPDPAQCGQTKTVTFSYAPGDATPGLRGYEIVVKVTGPVAAVSTAHFAKSGGLSSVGTTVFYVVDDGGGVFSVNESILGTTTGLLAAGDLFTLVLTTADDGVVDVAVESYRLRDPANMDIFADIGGVSFTVDCTEPPGVTDLTTAPGHQKVTLAWTMADASDVDHYEVWRAVWHTGDNVTSAYPEYDDMAADKEPTWPANHAAVLTSSEWTLVNGALPGTSVGYVDVHAPRGIYYYEVYTVDAAGNFGPGSSPDNRATNYWLGDVDPSLVYDGDVDVQDISRLGASYGFGGVHPFYNNHCDVGPTDDRSGLGIPLTDSTVGFEDLMIFAQNFGVVGPARQPAGGTDSPQLVWQRVDATTWSLLLAEPCTDLKGLHLTASLPEGATCSVTAGSLLAGQSSPGFAANAPDDGLNAGVALLGQGATIGGAGELLRVVFSADVELQPRVTARDGANGDLAVSMTTEITPVTPLRFAAHQNFPNPFNPRTSIAFVLPESREVRLAVYSLDGSRVRLLADGALPAGPHTVVWDGLDERGQDVASGAYFYRLEAGPDSQVRKMLLMK